MPEMIWFIVAALAALITTAVAVARRASASKRVEARSDPALERGSDGQSFWSELGRTRDAFAAALDRVIAADSRDHAHFEALEEALIGADVGVKTSMEIVASIRSSGGEVTDLEDLKSKLRTELLSRMDSDTALAIRSDGPLVILVVGVNGSGTTTTIGKLAHQYTAQGKKVLLAAGDTFRAGSFEQL